MTLRVYTDNNLAPEPWMVDSKCATTDPEIFFPAHGDRPATRRAVAICDTCDVRTQCLDYAMRTKQRFGVWGGMGRKQRELLRSRTS